MWKTLRWALPLLLAAGCARVAFNPESAPLETYSPDDLLALAEPASKANPPGMGGAGKTPLEMPPLTTTETLLLADLPTSLTQLLPAGSVARPVTAARAARGALERGRAIAIQKWQAVAAALDVSAQYGLYDLTLSATHDFTHDETQGSTPVNTNAATLSLSQKLPTGASIELHSDGSRAADEGVVDTIDYNLGAGLRFRQPLLRGWGVEPTEADLRRARHAREIACLAYQATARNEVVSALTLYWRWRGAIESWRASLWSLAAARELARVNRLQTGAEIIPVTEQLQAEAAAAARYAELIEARRTMDSLADELRRAMGLDAVGAAPPPLAPAEPLLWPAGQELAPVDLEQETSAALERRPELKSAREAVARAGLNERVARRQCQPQLDAVAGVDWTGEGSGFTQSRRELTGGRDYTFTAGLEFSVPLQNRAARYQAKQAEAQLAQARESESDARDQIAADSRAAARALNTAQAALPVAESQLRSAEENLRAAYAQYGAGVFVNASSSTSTAADGTTDNSADSGSGSAQSVLSPSYQLLQFQVDNATARRNLIAAFIDLKAARAALAK